MDFLGVIETDTLSWWIWWSKSECKNITLSVTFAPRAAESSAWIVRDDFLRNMIPVNWKNGASSYMYMRLCFITKTTTSKFRIPVR